MRFRLIHGVWVFFAYFVCSVLIHMRSHYMTYYQHQRSQLDSSSLLQGTEDLDNNANDRLLDNQHLLNMTNTSDVVNIYDTLFLSNNMNTNENNPAKEHGPIVKSGAHLSVHQKRVFALHQINADTVDDSKTLTEKQEKQIADRLSHSNLASTGKLYHRENNMKDNRAKSPRPNSGDSNQAEIKAADKPFAKRGIKKKPKQDEHSESQSSVDSQADSKISQEYSLDPEPRDMDFTPRYPDKIMYNRVGKCGSTTILNIMRGLSMRNTFHFYSSKTYREHQMDDGAQKELVDDVMTRDAPLLYVRHFYFTNFTTFNYDIPLYINVIRDPMERLVSAYYFRRLEDRRFYEVDKSDPAMNMTYDECVQFGHICRRPEGYFRVIPYFCGQEDKCLEPSDYSLQKAKHMVARYFPVVGILDNLEQFFAVLQYTFPRFFKYGHKAYLNRNDDMKSKYENTQKPPIEEKTKELMMPLLWSEYRFYAWIKQRIDQQAKIMVPKGLLSEQPNS